MTLILSERGGGLKSLVGQAVAGAGQWITTSAHGLRTLTGGEGAPIQTKIRVTTA